jgi:uncharacterized protein YndB with AHSA1/START domain
MLLPTQPATTGGGGRVAIEATRRMDASPATAWRALSEPALWPSWGPAVTDVECEDQQLRTGTTGRVRTPVGAWVPFTVTHVDPGHRWTWRVAGVPATGHRVEPGPDGCLIVFELPTWAFGYLPVCELALRRLERMLGPVHA